MWIRNKNMQLMNLKTEELKILALEYLDDDNIPDYFDYYNVPIPL